MDNNNNQFNNNEKQPKMPKFNMSWFYGIAIAIILGFLFFGNADQLVGSSGYQKATYTKFKEYVAKGYAKSVVVNKNDSELKLFIKAKNIQDVFHTNAD